MIAQYLPHSRTYMTHRTPENNTSTKIAPVRTWNIQGHVREKRARPVTHLVLTPDSRIHARVHDQTVGPQ
jgi:hypothetical protein